MTLTVYSKIKQNMTLPLLRRAQTTGHYSGLHPS